MCAVGEAGREGCGGLPDLYCLMSYLCVRYVSSGIVIT